MSHKKYFFERKKNSQRGNAPNIFFMVYLYLDASFRRLFKQKCSPADLMHSPISKSDHSGGPGQAPLELGIHEIKI